MIVRSKICLVLCIILLQTFFVLSQKSDSLKALLKNATHDTARCRILSILIEDLESENIWPDYNNEMIRIAENNLKTCPKKLRNYFNLFYALGINNSGFICMTNGKNQEAIELYERALKIQMEIKDKGNASATMVNLGYLFRQQGNIAKAIEYYHSALKLQIESGAKMEMATTYNNIAFIFDGQNEFKKALEYYERSLKINTEIKNKGGMANCLLNVAYLYKVSGDPDCKDDNKTCALKGNAKALSHLNEAVNLLKETNDKAILASTYNMIGTIYDGFGDPECKGSEEECKKLASQKALQYYEQALELRKEINSVADLSQSYQSLATYMFKRDDLKKALGYGLNSMSVAKELGSPEQILDAALILKNIYSKLNKPTESLKMYELYVQMKDSINNEETQNMAIKKTYQIDYEKKAMADSVFVVEEKKVAAAVLEEEKTKRFALYGGLALVMIFSAFMVNRFIVTNRQKKIIEHKEREAIIQNSVISEQKHLVEEKQKEILDSIHYAKRIQTALIANSKFINEHLPENFVYFNPKDIVSGDFYWASLHNNKFYLAICDSTGHGVPGGFMSLLNMGFLSEAIKEKGVEKPNEIFNYVRERLISTISSEGQKDGMDGILLCYDKKKKTFEYTAANNEPILIRDGNIIELPKDKMPVGKGEKTDSFTNHELDLKPGDQLFLYTDGYADQFGGPKGKKFMYKRLNELLLSLNNTPLPEQKLALERNFNDWKNALEQVDDVLIAGIKI